jgi:MFS family permease
MTPGPKPRFAVPILFAVVFIDLVGFGILAPLVPFYVERLGARPELITLIIAAHPLAQSLAMPLWGTLSDRRGRRPVLLASMFGHGAAYLVLGFADFVAAAAGPILSGATSANLSTAYAYIADVTTPEERAGAMAGCPRPSGWASRIGWPWAACWRAGTGRRQPAGPPLPRHCSLFSAFLAIFAFLPETRQLSPASTPRAAGTTLLGELGRIAGRPLISRMLIMATVVLVFMAVRESIFPLWAHHEHGLNARTLGLMLAWTGGLIALVQFFGIGWLAQRFGELNLVKGAIVCLMLGWLGLTLAWSLPTLLLAMTIGSFGTAFFQTSMQSLLSKRAGMAERGAVLGVYQSSSAMARFVGQAGAGTLYGQLGASAPFLLGSLAMLPAYAIAVQVGRKLKAAPLPGDKVV